MQHFWQPWTFFVIFFNNNLRFFYYNLSVLGFMIWNKINIIKYFICFIKVPNFSTHFYHKIYSLYNDFECTCHIFTWNNIPWPCWIQITQSVSWFILFQSLYKVHCDNDKKMWWSVTCMFSQTILVLLTEHCNCCVCKI